MPENFFTPRRIKIAAICFLVVSAVIIIYVLVSNLSHLGKIAVEIKYAPFEASVFIDNENYPKNNAVNYLTPGSHHVTVVLDGFKTLEEDVEITPETKYLYGALEALDETNVSVYQEYQKDYIAVEVVGGKESTQEAKELVETWPILDYLPYVNNNYSIGSLFDEQNNLVVTIRAETAQINNAINRLKTFKNITLSDYNIQIKDFTNPLEGKFVTNNNSDPASFLREGYRNLGLPYRVNDGQQSNNYYYTTISAGRYASNLTVNYRVIIQQNGSSWQLASTPYPILTIYNTPDVDSSILDLANQLETPMVLE